MQIQKKIIALAIASALTVPALAFAEATVFGNVNLSVDMVNNGAVTNSASANQLNSNTSRLGLKGTEDVGSGLSVVWQLEGTINPDSSTAAALFDRNNFIGLKSDSMGALTVGRNDTAYNAVTRRLDLFGDGIADNRGSKVAGTTPGIEPFTNIMMGGGHDRRVSNGLNYTSPNMSGVTVLASTVFGAETPVANSNKGSLYSLAGAYEQGPIYAVLAYSAVKAGTNGTGDQGAASLNALYGATGFGQLVMAPNDESKATELAGSYTTDEFVVNVILEQVKNTLGGVESKHSDSYIGGKFNVSSTDAVKLAYAKRGSTTSATNDATQVTVGYSHDMSKATNVYALYSKLTQNAANAADPSVISAGIKHSF